MSRVKLGDVAREYKATVKDASGLPIVMCIVLIAPCT